MMEISTNFGTSFKNDCKYLNFNKVDFCKIDEIFLKRLNKFWEKIFEDIDEDSQSDFSMEIKCTMIRVYIKLAIRCENTPKKIEEKIVKACNINKGIVLELIKGCQGDYEEVIYFLKVNSRSLKFDFEIFKEIVKNLDLDVMSIFSIVLFNEVDTIKENVKNDEKFILDCVKDFTKEGDLKVKSGCYWVNRTIALLMFFEYKRIMSEDNFDELKVSFLTNCTSQAPLLLSLINLLTIFRI